MDPNHKIFLTPGPLHMLFPVPGIFFPFYPSFHLPFLCLPLPMANLLFFIWSQQESLTHSFIHSLTKYVSHAYYMPGTMVSTRQSQHLLS